MSVDMRNFSNRGIQKAQIWDDCICGINKTIHTRECKSNHRKNYLHNFSTVIRQEQRKERKSKHLCIQCGEKTQAIKCPHCKKIIGYKSRCKQCADSANEYSKERNKKIRESKNNEKQP